MLPVQSIFKQTGINKGLVYSWFTCMNTRIDIVLCDKEEEESKGIIGTIYNQLNNLEKKGNYFDPSSELSIINNSCCNMPVTVSKDLLSMIKMCIEYNKMTEGYFDISMDSYNYTTDTLEYICISENDQSITFGREGIKLNLSGFIKGYALDKVREIFKENNIENALLNAGNSSVLALGNHPFGKGWKIGIDFPIIHDNKIEITLNNKCFTTSGNQSVNRKHIKSPYTGKYIDGVKGISVITDTAAEGEALSTALFAAESDRRMDILRHFDAIVYNI